MYSFMNVAPTFLQCITDKKNYLKVYSFMNVAPTFLQLIYRKNYPKVYSFMSVAPTFLQTILSFHCSVRTLAHSLLREFCSSEHFPPIFLSYYQKTAAILTNIFLSRFRSPCISRSSSVMINRRANGRLTDKVNHRSRVATKYTYIYFFDHIVATPWRQQLPVDFNDNFKQEFLSGHS